MNWYVFENIMQSHNVIALLIPDAGYSAMNAVDRNYGTCMRTDQIGLNSRSKTSWWKMDLGEVYNISRKTILFRNYDSYGLYLISNYVLTVKNAF